MALINALRPAAGPSHGRRAATSIASTSAPARSAAPVPFVRAEHPETSTDRWQIRTKRTGSEHRDYPERKRFLMRVYARLLTRSSVALFLRPSELATGELTAVQAALKALPPVPGAASDDPDARPALTFVRSGLIPPLLRRLPQFQKPSTLRQLGIDGKTFRGELCLLTLPAPLHPPTLAAALRIVAKASEQPNARREAAAKAATAAATRAGARPAPAAAGAATAPKPKRLRLMRAVVEDTVADAERVKQISALPELRQLQSEIIGLLSGPSYALVGLLGHVSGQSLLATLDGHRRGLEAGGDDAAPVS